MIDYHGLEYVGPKIGQSISGTWSDDSGESCPVAPGRRGLRVIANDPGMPISPKLGLG